jgi:uncharacterized membrane protein YozB (DUF420 family)
LNFESLIHSYRNNIYLFIIVIVAEIKKKKKKERNVLVVEFRLTRVFILHYTKRIEYNYSTDFKNIYTNYQTLYRYRSNC